MRGKPVSGFRLTKNRMKAGVLTKKLLVQLRQIEELQRQGKRLPPLLAQANVTIQKNAQAVQRHGLLSQNVEEMHAVDKSALRRRVLHPRVMRGN